MKRAFFTSLCLLLTSAGFSALAASIGDPAPPLSIERWIKGAPARIGSGTNIYVIEFWATWCPPCRKSIPYMTEMQKKYAQNGVVVIGVSDEAAATVQSFVAAQGENMAYHVAVDSSKRSFKSWMHAYGQRGIPHVFVVGTNGTVLWHGYPGSRLDQALNKIVSGTYDIEFAQYSEAGERLVEQYKSIVAKSNAAEKAAPLGDKIVEEYSRDWRVAHRLARAILTDPAVRSRDLPLALRASTKANELTKNRNWDVLGLHARALFANGKKDEAVETQKQAIALCNDAESRAEFEKFLALFQKGAQQAK
jgi:thiol-disulfide isomerase/thioredoxin